MNEFLDATKDGPFMALDVNKGIEALKMKLEKDISAIESK